VVKLDRIYTRGGDRGSTSLGDGTRVAKTDPRIAAYGTVDELNAVLGVAVLQRGLSAAARRDLRAIQNQLFDVGADLCVPLAADEAAGTRLRITAAEVGRLEAAIDAATARLTPLRSFVLPGGTAAAAWLHMARVVCRRAEIEVARLRERDPISVNEQVLVYLNRLSDLLFVLARRANRDGRDDVLWVPGGSTTAPTKPRRTPRRVGR
jgi:cob(I)alamin adenosyltransferase